MALRWPGWARSARDEPAALETLAVYLPRYTAVVRRAGLDPPARPDFEVVERHAGTPITDFGALQVRPTADAEAAPRVERERWAALLQACWSALDGAVQAAPEQLRKGPRGGGREAAAIFDHVYETDRMVSAVLGRRVKKGAPASELRAGIVQALLAAEGRFSVESRYGIQWTPMFAARRSAWHALDHTWEIEDRSTQI